MPELLLDRYKPLGRSIEGGYGTVIVAFDERMHRRVAIKQIPLESFGGQTIGLEEARTAALLNHPNIVAVHDFEVSEDSALLIMEYVDGVTLEDIPSEEITLNMVATIIKSVGSAISYAHQNGVLHLDIKPANILINHEGQVKVADFGISLLSHEHGHDSAGAGTIGYMPYEQLNGEPATARTDQWAFAALIYELLTDEYPYEEVLEAVQQNSSWRHPFNELDAMRDAQDEGEPHLIETTIPELNTLLATALSVEPFERFDTVRELTERLLTVVGDPTLGKKELSAVVQDLMNDDISDYTSAGFDESVYAGVDAAQVWGGIARVFAAMVAATLAYHSMTAFGIGTEVLTLIVALVVGVLMGVTPALGSGIALIVLAGVALGSGHWLLGALALVAGMPWWYFCARRSQFSAIAGMTIVLALVEINWLSPAIGRWYAQLLGNNLGIGNALLAALFILVSIAGLRRSFVDGWHARSIDK